MLKKLTSIILTVVMLIPMFSYMGVQADSVVSVNDVMTDAVVSEPSAGDNGNKNSGVVVPGIAKASYPESPHSYYNYMDQTWTYTHGSFATFLDVTFSSQTKVESGYDKIYIYTLAGEQIGEYYTGTSLANRTITVPGNGFKIRLTTDGSVTYYGFSISSIVAYTVDDPGNYPESPHPYSNNYYKTWRYTYPADVSAIKVTFSNDTEFENNYDKLYIYDGTGYLVGTYTGTQLKGKTISINGNTFTITLDTDYSITRYGFKIDSISADFLANGSCGSNLNWWLSSDGVLSIMGNGAMTNFASASSPGWYSYRSSIKRVVVGEYVTSIGSYAFSSCSNLATVTIGSSVTSVGTKAFNSCSKLKSVYISDIGKWCNISFYDSGANPLNHSASLYINGELATHISVPSTVTTIGQYAFYNCSSILDVTMADSVKTVGQYAFYGCSNLINVIFGSNVSRIDDYSFKNCYNLTNVSVPLSVKYIDYGAFSGCSSLLNVYYTGSRTNWRSISIGSDNSYLTTYANIHYDGDEFLAQVEVLSAPTKRTYYIGDTLNTQGLRLKLTYRDGTVRSVTSGFSVSGFDSSVPGVKSVRVSYAGMSAMFVVTIKYPIIQLSNYIKIMRQGQSSTLTVSTEPSSFSVNWSSSDTSILTVSNGTITAISPGTAYAYASITYNGITYTKGCEVIVEAHEIQGIYIDRMPYKTTYELGEEFDPYGLRIRIKYTDGSADKLVTSGYTLSGYVSYQPGQKTITVRYSEKIATFYVKVNSSSIRSITLYSPPDKTSYYIGDAVDTTGLELKLTFDNYNTSILSEGFSVTPSFISTSTTALTATFQGERITIPLTVTRPSVTLSATSVALEKGEVHTLIASTDPDYQLITWSSSDPEVASVDNDGNITANSAGYATVTAKFTYNGRTYPESCSVAVKGKLVESVVVQNKPNKLTYYAGETLDTTGLKLKVTYNNREVEYITEGFTIESYDLSTVGTKQIVVNYGGKSTTFSITVTEAVVSSISIETLPAKTQYYIGDNFSKSGLTVHVTMGDGSESIISDGFEITEFDSSATGTRKAKVVYSGKSAEFSYTVVSPAVTVSLSSKSIYIGDTYTLTASSDPQEQVIVWSSSNTNIATVSDGKVNGRAAGTVNISAKIIYNGKEYSAVCKVTVKIPSVNIALDSKSINVGDSYTLSYTTEPANQTVTWSSMDTNYVTVSNAKVKGIKNGSATVVATLYYGGNTYTDSCIINVKKSTIVSSISVYRMPDKTQYYIGDSFSKSGMQLKVTYSDGGYSIIDKEFDVTGVSFSSAGEKTLTAEYSGKSCTFKVTVNTPSLTLSSNERSLYCDDTYTIKATAIPGTVTVNWTTSDSKVAKVSGGTITALKPGTATITASFTYNGDQYTAKCVVKVIERISVSKIEIASLPNKVEYYIGDYFDTTGLELKVTNSDNSVINVDSGYDISGFNSAKEGTVNIIVTYSSKTTGFSVKIKKPSINLSTNNVSIRAEESYALSVTTEPAGLSVSWSSTNTSFVTVSDGIINAKKPGTVSVTAKITYNGNEYTESCIVKVTEKLAITDISIFSMPDKTVYYRGDALDTKGLAITVRYNDGRTEYVNEGFIVSGYSSQKLGTQQLTVNYSGIKTTFDITLKTPSISIISTTYSFDIGDTFTLDTIAEPEDVTVNWISDNPSVVTVNSDGSFTANKAGTSKLTAFFGYNTVQYMAEATITVNAYRVVSLNIDKLPKTEYLLGDAFDSEGIAVTAVYNDGTTKKLTKSDLEFKGFDMLSVGTQTVTISYMGCTGTYNIKVATPFVIITNGNISLMVGESFKLKANASPSELNVVWNSSNDSVASVSDGTVMANKKGTAVITASVTYKENTYSSECVVTVDQLEVSSVSIDTMPAKLTYKVGDKIDTTGLVLKVKFENGTTSLISSGFSVSELSYDSLGEQKITVTYGSKKASYYVEVELSDLGFSDVKSNHWFALSVAYCVNKGYIAGMSETKFQPNGTLTRAQFVTILAKFDGTDLNAYKNVESGFEDVKLSHWYHNAVTWAKVKGYANGLSTTKFGPNNNVTREQLARFFYTYAEKNAMSVSGRANLSVFPDHSKVATWAKDSFEWAVDSGLISGVNRNGVNMLDPKSTATRAQATVMFKAFDALR